MPTEQSSIYYNMYSEYNVDGNPAAHFWQWSCSHTSPDVESYPWWKVDLGGIFQIETVAITNRKDCCYQQFADVVLSLGKY